MASDKTTHLLQILSSIDLSTPLKSQALEGEKEIRDFIATKITEQEDVIEQQQSIDSEIRRMQLAILKHQWDDGLKVTQAKSNKWSKKEYEEKVHYLEHNYNHLLNIIDDEEYQNHLELVTKIDGHEDTIETLLRIQEKRQAQEEYLQNNPPESFISRVAKERVEIK